MSLGTSVEKLNDLSETYKEMLGIFLQTLQNCRLVLLFKYNFRAAEKSSLDCIMCSSVGYNITNETFQRILKSLK